MANAILFCVLPGRTGCDSHGSRRRPGHPIMRARGSIGLRPQPRPTAPLSLPHPSHFHPLECGHLAPIRSYHGSPGSAVSLAGGSLRQYRMIHLQV